MLRQYRRLASGAERLRWGTLAHMARVAHALALYRRLVAALVGRALFAHCCCRKITPLIFRRSTKFTGTGAHFSAE